MTTPQPPDVRPLDVNGVAAIVVGTVGWLIALVVVLLVDRHSWWVWVCVTGFGLGVIGIPTQARYQRRMR